MRTFRSDTPLPEYPRPNLRREGFVSLNGYWEYAIQDGGRLEGLPVEAQPAPTEYEGEIVVPFSPESGLSGVGRILGPDDVLWYRRTFDFPAPEDGEHLLLNFEAVDWECAVRVNGVLVGTHQGGYEPFSLDVTGALRGDGGFDELAVCVRDPTEFGAQPRGKQRLEEGGIWYRPQSGIWQTVWAEAVPQRHVVSLDAVGDVADGVVVVRLRVSGFPETLSVAVLEGGSVVARHVEELAETASTVRIPIGSPRLWSPDDPFLYGIEVRYGRDEVTSCCAFRTVGVGGDAGARWLTLNGERLAVRGVLVQGYWPDGLMTAPSDDALVRDIVAAREHGFNAVRMHAKVERRRFYHHCDRLGMLVLQDLVPGGRRIRMRTCDNLAHLPPVLRRLVDDRSAAVRFLTGAGSREERDGWLRESIGEVELLRSHPCIISWTVFNEGWGQFFARRVTALVREADPTRPVDSTSGWFDQGAGDFLSVHDYSSDLRELGRALACGARRRPPGGRATLLSECGGLSFVVAGHAPSEGAWGYAQYDEQGEFVGALSELLATLDRRVASGGLAGFVYTQLYDVESECNGLLTYDREADKARP